MRCTIVLLTLISKTFGGGVGTAWDISPSKNIESTTNPSWLRGDSSAFEIRSVSGVGHHQESTQEFTDEQVTENPGSSRNSKELEDMENDYDPEILFDNPVLKSIFRTPRKELDVEIITSGAWEKSIKSDNKFIKNRGSCPESLEDNIFNNKENIKPRHRRDLTDDTKIEKINGIKNVREGRMSIPTETWSKPMSIEFRKRSSLDGLFKNEDTESKMINHEEPPHVDFITANRRSSIESRESKDLPLHSYDDVSYKNDYNNFRDSRDLDMAYSRSYYYPDQIRTQREFMIHGLSEPTFSPDRYRIEDFDMYRNRPTPKPKRIIYYATLPEIVRKPVDLRSFPRPYDNMGRASIPPPITRDPYYKKLPSPIDLRYRYRNYPTAYDSYDPYMKKSTYYDRPYGHAYDRFDDYKHREQDVDHASFKETPRAGSELRKNDNGESRSEEKSQWPVQVGTEVNIKDTDRNSNRKNYGSHQEFDRLRTSSRIEQSSEQPSGDNRN